MKMKMMQMMAVFLSVIFSVTANAENFEWCHESINNFTQEARIKIYDPANDLRKLSVPDRVNAMVDKLLGDLNSSAQVSGTPRGGKVKVSKIYDDVYEMEGGGVFYAIVVDDVPGSINETKAIGIREGYAGGCFSFATYDQEREIQKRYGKSITD